MKIKLTDKQTCRLTFIHAVTKEPSSLFIAMNPLTGDWMQTHKVGEKESSYFGTKTDAISLANNIIKKSIKMGLTWEVITNNVTT